MTIIKLETMESGGHSIEMQSHRTENWMGNEWAIVPDELTSQLNNGYCDVIVEMDAECGLVVTAVTPTEAPEQVADATDWDLMAQSIAEGVNEV